MERQYVMTFTKSEEAEVRRALIEYVKRVSSGQCTVTEAGSLPFMVNVMFPDIGPRVQHSVSDQMNTSN